MTSDDNLIPEPVLDQAVAWAVRLHDSPDDTAARAEFEGWLAQGDVQARAWAKTQKAWVQMGQVPAAFAQEWPTRRVASFPVAPRRRYGLRSAVAGLAACLLVALAIPTLRVWISADYATAVAETRQVPLEDGSTIHLGADSAVAVNLKEGERQ